MTSRASRRTNSRKSKIKKTTMRRQEKSYMTPIIVKTLTKATNRCTKIRITCQNHRMYEEGVSEFTIGQILTTISKCRLLSLQRSSRCKTKEIDHTQSSKACMHRMLQICSQFKTLATVAAVNLSLRYMRCRSKRTLVLCPSLWVAYTLTKYSNELSYC